jgi:NADH-quinone oxidoreductase subunit A
MLFDLEIAFLLPWATNLGNLGTASFITMLLFLLLFVIGLIYE